ncbi:hypothetical protein GQ44DRAFT_3469 [Phaeosphaeriaceae sp. PMI808]|nr:hypothetical protein GQ44DRAFT_3469 [Phaeosphaeriaceae sp. PMI808]
MCYYRLYIFLGCGHSTFSPTPVSHCMNATRLAKPIAQKETSPKESNLKDKNTALGLDQDQGTQKEAWLIKSTIDLKDTSMVLALDQDQTSQLDVTVTSQRSSITQSSQATSNNETPAETPRERTTTRLKEISSFEPCSETRMHPLHTVKVEHICATCAHERDERLCALEGDSIHVKYEPEQWRWRYSGRGEMPLSNRPSVESDRGVASVVEDSGEEKGVESVGETEVDSGEQKRLGGGEERKVDSDEEGKVNGSEQEKVNSSEQKKVDSGVWSAGSSVGATMGGFFRDWKSGKTENKGLTDSS